MMQDFKGTFPSSARLRFLDGFYNGPRFRLNGSGASVNAITVEVALSLTLPQRFNWEHTRKKFRIELFGCADRRINFGLFNHERGESPIVKTNDGLHEKVSMVLAILSGMGLIQHYHIRP